MEDYKSNSHKSKALQKEAEAKAKTVEKVVAGTVKTKKKSEGFISEDILSNIWAYIRDGVLIPTAKRAIDEIVTNGTRMMLWGESAKDRGGNALPGSFVSYNKAYNQQGVATPRPSYGTGFSYDDLVFNTRGDADLVLSKMDEIMSVYHMVRVADLYQLAGVSTDNYTANDYGWTDIRSARIVPVRDGYVIKLPRAFPLD